RTLSRSSGLAITSGVSPARLSRGATGTPWLFRRAIAMRESPPCAVGIAAKLEEVPLLIVHLSPRRAITIHGLDEQMFGLDYQVHHPGQCHVGQRFTPSGCILWRGRVSQWQPPLRVSCCRLLDERGYTGKVPSHRRRR